MEKAWISPMFLSHTIGTCDIIKRVKREVILCLF